MDNTQLDITQTRHAKELGRMANEIVSKRGEDNSYISRGQQRPSKIFKEAEIQIEKYVLMLTPKKISGLRVKCGADTVLELQNSLKYIKSYSPGYWEARIERLYNER